MALRDLALTVLELEPNEFHWVLMEAVQADSEECLGYRPIDSSTQGLPDYSQALIQGASALRVLQGLAPFGKPVTPVGIGESADEALQDNTSDSMESSSIEDLDQDSCMFTTNHSAL